MSQEIVVKVDIQVSTAEFQAEIIGVVIGQICRKGGAHKSDFFHFDVADGFVFKFFYGITGRKKQK